MEVTVNTACDPFVKALQTSTEVGEKYRAIFELKQIGTSASVKALIDNYNNLDNSDLLKHEVTYALGQMSLEFIDIIKPFLLSVLEDETEYAVARHEAGEGLSNFSGIDASLLAVFERHSTSPVPEVAGTCQIAADKARTYEKLELKYAHKYSSTREPAAPLSIEELNELLGESGSLLPSINEKVKAVAFSLTFPLFVKYRALYLLRDTADPASIDLLSTFLSKKHWDVTNNLFRHEVCFVIGQIGENAKASIEQLKITALDSEENEIVRHEALSAYSSIAEDTDFLKQFINDPSRIVRESAIVALDLIKYWGTAACGC